jgi:hypothetical protein
LSRRLEEYLGNFKRLVENEGSCPMNQPGIAISFPVSLLRRMLKGPHAK